MTVYVDLSELYEAVGKLEPLIKAGAGDAITVVAQRGMEHWQTLVQSANLWSGEKSPYYHSIKWRFTSPDNSSAEIFTEYKLAKEIEDGRPAKDLKQILQRSPRVRVSQSGSRYLYIPFRHSVEELKSAGLYNAVKPTKNDRNGFLSSTIRETTLRESHVRTNMLVHKQNYAWGSRLKVEGKHNHLYRFDTSTVNPETGKKQTHSNYLTFRTMSSTSSGWIIPARPGLKLAEQTENWLQREAYGIVKSAFSL